MGSEATLSRSWEEGARLTGQLVEGPETEKNLSDRTERLARIAGAERERTRGGQTSGRALSEQSSGVRGAPGGYEQGSDTISVACYRSHL